MPIVWSLVAIGCATEDPPDPAVANVDDAVTWACTAPYITPTYSTPPSDAVAFEALVEASGYLPSSQSNWIDAQAGNICGGSGAELVLVKNQSPFFSVMQGRAPYVVKTNDAPSNANYPWRAIAIGNVAAPGQQQHDHIVGVRNTSAPNGTDLVVMRADPTSCAFSTVGSGKIGAANNQDWKGVAIGDFDGGNQAEMALVRLGSPNFVVVKLNNNSLTTSYTATLDSNSTMPWEALVAGDLDNDGLAELVAARSVSNGTSPTIFLYKWNGTAFVQRATSTFGNNGSSTWSSITIGDFNGDGTKSIAVQKNSGSTFTLLRLVVGSSTLEITASDTLDTATAAPWVAVTAADWIGGDAGARELVAVRAASDPYRSDILVYGDDFHRASRDSALTNVKSQSYFERCDLAGNCPDWENFIPTIISNLEATHSNTYQWLLRDPGDYTGLVSFLEQTKSKCIDGQQLRVWVSLKAFESGECSMPENSPLTPFNEATLFPAPFQPGTHTCDNLPAWGNLLGQLAVLYPHLVSIGFDDFSHRLDPEEYPPSPPEQISITTDEIARLQSYVRAQAEWVSFAPTVYYDGGGFTFLGDRVADLGRLVDTFVYFFRNDKAGACESGCDTGATPLCAGGCPDSCLAGACAERTIKNAPAEFCDMRSLLPRGRKMQLGIYFSQHCTCGTPSTAYAYDLARLVTLRPWLGFNGLTAYQMPSPNPSKPCSGSNYLDDDNKFCAVQRLFSGVSETSRMSDIDLTTASCLSPQDAAGDPHGYTVDSQGLHNVVYRGTDNHIYELWRNQTSIGSSRLSTAAGASTAASDPMAYFVPSLGTHNVIYRGTDSRIHDLWWTATTPVSNANITNGSPAPTGRPWGFVAPFMSRHVVQFRGTDNNLYESSWWNGAVSTRSITSGTQTASADPFGHSTDAYNSVVGYYRTSTGNLYELYWSTPGGPVGVGNLTASSGAPAPATAAQAWAYMSSGNVQNVLFRGVDSNIHWLSYTTGTPTRRQVTGTVAPTASSDPVGWVANNYHHVFYRASGTNDLWEYWITFNPLPRFGANNITAKTLAPTSQSRPSSYYSTSGTAHVLYRDASNHTRSAVGQVISA